MSDLSGYYNSLFVIQVTVFGIGFAGLIALMQVLRPLLSFKSTQRMIKGVSFVTTSILLVISILSTSLATLLLSLDRHNYLWFNAHSDAIVHSEWFAILNLLLVISTFIGLALAIIQETKYLIPSNALDFLSKQTTPDAIKSYFEDAYLPMPTPPIHIRFFNATADDTDERSDEEINAEYEKKLEDYNRRKTKIADKENPLLPLESYLMQAVRRDDLQASQAALRSLEKVIIDVTKSKHHKILYELVKYYSAIIDNCIELAGAHGLQSVLLEAVESTDRIATALVERKSVNELNPLIDLWQDVGDEYMGKQPAVFRSVMSAIRSAGEGIINETSIETEKMKETADNIDRCLGWLGERMLSGSKPEEKMLMNIMYETEFSALMNAVLGVGYAFERSRPDMYPLIHYDCLYVIADKLAPYCVDSERDTDNRNTLFSLMYEIKTFAERTIDEGNIRGASLSIMRLKEHYDIAKKNNLEEQMEHCLVAMMDVGAYAAGSKFRGAAEFLRTKSIPDEAIRLISENIGSVDLSSEAMEIIIKHPTDLEHSDVTDYLIELGDNLGTTFGLNLNPSDKKN
ncbi:MAG TPA: hypothetical protein VK497_03865 [Candidatus Saccharimonadales bacterium]|nr:hypothetical protein [Candidatus Saccharimonadales bacterium]